MKVLVTGAASMLGRCVCKELFKKNHTYIAIAHNDKNWNGCHSFCDLLDKHELYTEIDKWWPNVIVHCGGYNGGILFNEKEPWNIWSKTITMANNILEVANYYKVKKVVTLLTSCAYPAKDGALREEEFLEGQPHKSVACHGYAKRMSFIAGQMLYKQYQKTKPIGVILNNCYGYEKYNPVKTKVCGSLIKKFLDAKKNNEKEVVVWGTGNARRELLFCEDAAEGIVLALEKYEDWTTPLNIGSGKDQTIKVLAETIKNIVGYSGNIVFDSTKPDGQKQKLLDVTRMKNILNWTPPTTLEVGISKTLNYINNNCV